MSKLEALVVDFGGVLTTPLQEAMMSFADALGIELQDLVRVALGAYSGAEDNLVTEFEKGTISDQEFSRQFAGRLTEVSGVDVPTEGLVDRIFGDMRLEEDMMSAVMTAKRAGFKTGLLSNSWGLGLYPRQRFPEMFDSVIISGEVGMRKPDEAIYRLATDRLGWPWRRRPADDHLCIPGRHSPGMMTISPPSNLRPSQSPSLEQTSPHLPSLLPGSWVLHGPAEYHRPQRTEERKGTVPGRRCPLGVVVVYCSNGRALPQSLHILRVSTTDGETGSPLGRSDRASALEVLHVALTISGPGRDSADRVSI